MCHYVFCLWKVAYKLQKKEVTVVEKMEEDCSPTEYRSYVKNNVIEATELVTYTKVKLFKCIDYWTSNASLNVIQELMTRQSAYKCK